MNIDCGDYVEKQNCYLRDIILFLDMVRDFQLPSQIKIKSPICPLKGLFKENLHLYFCMLRL